jgi:hypothetical protein
MPSEAKPLGILQPLGGGDPIPLHKEELVVGRRPTCDIQLAFENVSGKHCVLRLIKGIWHLRDLGSTNGTTLNSQRIDHEQSVLPEDEIGIAGHYFKIDYEPTGPAAVQSTSAALSGDEEIVEQKRQHSLLELAGLGGEVDRGLPTSRARPKRPPERIVRPSADEADFEDAVPKHFKPAAPPKPAARNDDDFLKLIENEVPKKPKS